jgi:aspartate/methionine/tyrosine aminotransferase
LVLSYPHNPTTALAPLGFFEEAVVWARQQDLVLVHDFPYLDLVFEATQPAPSIFQATTQKENIIEFFTFSKSYNMGGFRIGFAIGGAELITALRRIKAVVDFNQYQGILQGAIVALEQAPTLVPPTVATFAKRREILVEALAQKGWAVSLPPATPYLWAPLPPPWQDRSLEFCLRLLQETGVALAPGRGFGANGEGYVRFALVQEAEKLQQAVAHIATFLAKG